MGADIDGRLGSETWNARTTRGGFLRAAAGGAAWVALGGSLAGTLGCEPEGQARASAAAAPSEQAWAFRSRPDLRPPGITVATPAREGTAKGLVFCAPKNGPDEAGPGQDGCLILDNDGQPVWFRPLLREDRDVMDFKLQRYRGRPVLTWWEGVHTGYGQGEYVLMDETYREVGRVRAGNGYDGDHHEFVISPQGTALFDIYGRVPMDLSPYGGGSESVALEGVVQEVDIESGEVLFEWHSLDHIDIDESYGEPPENPEFVHDYFHINSIDVDHDDNLIVSARRTSAVYKIDRETGEVIWRLGGKKSDFEMGPGTRTDWQHHARRQPDGTITIFDNGGASKDEFSRAIVVRLDEDAMKATLVRAYTHPDGVFADTQGSMQILPNGNVFVGWGSEPVISEFSGEGDLLFDANFPTEGESYRSFRFEWEGRPHGEPAMAVDRGSGEGTVTVYVSWNGSTHVSDWEVLAGPGPERLEPVALASRKGFETRIAVETDEPWVGVRPKDASGEVIGPMRTIETKPQGEAASTTDVRGTA